MLSDVSPIWRLLVRAVVAFVVLLGLAVLSVVCTTYNWDGNFEQVEFRLTFIDRAGKPLEGVELRVTDSSGNPFTAYPISDFLAGKPLLSDVNGQLVCHHVRFALEFGGHACRLFWIIPVGERAPVFRCRFFLHGKEFYSCDYGELAHTASHSRDVLRSWDLEPFISEFKRLSGSQQHVLNGKDRNRDGTVSASERAAWNTLVDAYDEYEEKNRRGLSLSEDRRFRVVERSIMLDR